MHSRLKLFLVEFLGVALVGYIAVLVLLYTYQRDMIYFPPAVNGLEDHADLKGFKAIEVRTDDEITLKAYFVPPAKNKPIILLFHGNANAPAWEAFKVSALREKGYGALLATYRGYAGNPGAPSQAGLFKDGEAYMAWLKRNYLSAPVVLYGQSLGSGVAVELAVHHKIAALILEVPFYSALSVAQRAYPYILRMDLLMKDPYRNDLKIKDVKAPILFLLAGQDEVVSLQSGLDLFAAANDPKSHFIYEKAHHANIYNFGAANAVMDFLEKGLR